MTLVTSPNFADVLDFVLERDRMADKNAQAAGFLLGTAHALQRKPSAKEAQAILDTIVAFAEEWMK